MLKKSVLSKFIFSKGKNSSFSLIKKYFSICPTQVVNYNYTAVKTSVHENNVGVIQLWRPEKKNALNSILIQDLNHALFNFENDKAIGAIVLCGDKEYFAAGADIKEMSDKNYSDVYGGSLLDEWNYITKIRYII